MNLIEREPTVAAPCHLVPSGEKAAHALTDVVIDTAQRCHRRPQIEVIDQTEWTVRLSRTSGQGSLWLGTSSSRTFALSRCTLFFEGLALM